MHGEWNGTDQGVGEGVADPGREQQVEGSVVERAQQGRHDGGGGRQLVRGHLNTPHKVSSTKQRREHLSAATTALWEMRPEKGGE